MDPVAQPPEPHHLSSAAVLSQDAAETARLAALHALGLLDTACEERFDRIVALVRVIFQVPVAAITLIDADRQWIKSATGIASAVATPRNYSPCHYTVQHPGILTVTDAAADTRVADMTVVHQGIRFYAGYPLTAPTGERVGSLCIMDTTPRRFTAEEQEILGQMGRVVEWELAATDELAAAAAAQRALIPAGTAQLPGYEIAGRCTPARSTQGSYFDWYQHNDRIQLHLADVIGGGTSAAVIAACVRTLIRAVHQDNDHGHATHRTAEGIRALLGDTETFVTAFAATLDPATGAVTYVLAGPGVAAVLGSDGLQHRLGSSGAALGLSPAHGTSWQAETTVLAPGQTLLVLGDGFLALDPDPQHLVDQALNEVAARYPDGIQVHQAVELATAWAVTQGHPTDITVLALHRTDTGHGPGRPQRG